MRINGHTQQIQRIYAGQIRLRQAGTVYYNNFNNFVVFIAAVLLMAAELAVNNLGRDFYLSVFVKKGVRKVAGEQDFFGLS